MTATNFKVQQAEKPRQQNFQGEFSFSCYEGYLPSCQILATSLDLLLEGENF